MTVHLPSLRQLWRAQPDAPGATAVLALCDEVERLTLDLDRAEHGRAYWERCATETDTKTYRALVERTAERDALRERLREMRGGVA